MSRALLGLLFFVLCGSPAAAQVDVRTYVPKAAYALAPQLRAVQASLWSDAPAPWFLAGQVEQESCITLMHPYCWNPRAQLRTSREWGRGLLQVTTAYNANGSVRFDAQADLRRQYASLRGWTLDKWADTHYQLTALVEMDHGIYRRVPDAATSTDQWAFTLSGYNGGEGGVRQDRLLCKNTKGCDPARWFGNVANQSLKLRRPYPGYAQSPFQINRGYVEKIINVRAAKYKSFFRGSNERR